MGPKRESYPLLPESLDDIFAVLMSHNLIQLPPHKENWSPRVDMTKYYPYHRASGHLLATYFTFKDWTHDMNDAGRINWADLKMAIENLWRPPHHPPPNDIGIVRNPLPNYQGQQQAI